MEELLRPGLLNRCVGFLRAGLLLTTICLWGWLASLEDASLDLWLPCDCMLSSRARCCLKITQGGNDASVCMLSGLCYINILVNLCHSQWVHYLFSLSVSALPFLLWTLNVLPVCICTSCCVPLVSCEVSCVCVCVYVCACVHVWMCACMSVCSCMGICMFM